MKPLKLPPYNFRNVPYCENDLKNSVILEVTERSHFTNSMAEMVLMCNEVMRRQQHKKKKKKAKPLGLEYISDRLDVDDSISGYFVRTSSQASKTSSSTTDDERVSVTDRNKHVVDESKWLRGMLQGFITIITFTNYQRTFRWDSMHDSALAYDDADMGRKLVAGVRKYDTDGILAEGR